MPRPAHLRAPDSPLRVGVVGLGWVGTHRHLPALRRSRSWRVAGVADRDGARAAQWGQRLGVAHATVASSPPASSASDSPGRALAEVPWLHEVDVVDVATAPMAHHALVREALALGKHVITEKPFAMTVAEGEELVALAAARGLQLGIVHNFQFASSVQRLLADLQQGRLGTVRSIVAFQWGNPRRRLPSWYEELPGGLFYDESPHLLYLVRRFAPGPLRLVGVDHCASTQGLRTPASIDASLRCAAPAGEIPVTVSCRFEAPLSEWHVAVLGERGAGVVDVFRDIYLRLPEDGAHGALQVLRTSWTATAMHWMRHLVNGPLHLAGRLSYGNTEVFERFARAVHTGVAPEGMGAADALAVLRLQHAILARAGVPGAAP